MKTFTPSQNSFVPLWHLIDANDQVLGRLASQIAPLLMGKHKPVYVTHLEAGDHVVVINARGVVTTGKKVKQKEYFRYSGFPGGLRRDTLGKLNETHPDRVLRLAVSGMLPRNKLHDRMLKRLHIYADESHPYSDKLVKKS